MTKKSKKRLTSALIVTLIVVLALSALVGCTDGEKTQVTITFKNGDQVVKTVIIDKDAAIAENQLPTDPTLEGHEFVGWFNGETKFVKDATFAESVTFEAKFEALQKVTVTFVNGETTVATVEVFKGQTVAAADIPESPEAEEGEFFAGWFNDEVKFVASEPINADVTFTAVFKAFGEEKGEYKGYATLNDKVLVLNGDGTGTFDGEAIEYVIETKDVEFCGEVLANFEVVTADKRIILNLESKEFKVNDGFAGTYTNGEAPDLLISGYGFAAISMEELDLEEGEEDEPQYVVYEYIINADGTFLIMVDEGQYVGFTLDKETMTYSLPETDGLEGVYILDSEEEECAVLLDGLGSVMAAVDEETLLYGAYKVEGNTLEISGLGSAIDGVYTLELDGALLVSDSKVFANVYIDSIDELNSGKYYSEELGIYVRFIQKEVDDETVYGLKVDLQNYWGTVTDHGYSLTVSAPHGFVHGGEAEGTVEFKIACVLGQLVLIHECDGEEVAVMFGYSYGLVELGDAYIGTWTAEDETQVEIDGYSVSVNGEYGSNLDSHDALGLYTFVVDGVEYVVFLNWDGTELTLATLSDEGDYENVKHLSKSGEESEIPAEFVGTWTGSYTDEEGNKVDLVLDIMADGWVADSLCNVFVSVTCEGSELIMVNARGEEWLASLNGDTLYYMDGEFSIMVALTKSGPVMPAEYIGVWTGVYQDQLANDVNVTVTVTNDGVSIVLESFTWKEVLESVSFEIDPEYFDLLFVTANDENWTIQNMYGTLYLMNEDSSVYAKLTKEGGEEPDPAEEVEVPEEFYGIWLGHLEEQFGETVYTTDYGIIISAEGIVFGIVYDGEEPYYLDCTAKSYDAETKKLVIVDSDDTENWLILNGDGTIQLQDGYSGGYYLDIQLTEYVIESEEA